MARPTPVGARYSPNASRSVQPHSPVVTPALAQAIEAGMMLPPSRRGALELVERRGDRLARRARAPGLEPLDLLGLGLLRHRHDRARRRRSSGEGSVSSEAVDADHDLLAALDRLEPRGVGFDQLLLHVADLDRGDRAAHLLDARELLLGLAP